MAQHPCHPALTNRTKHRILEHIMAKKKAEPSGGKQPGQGRPDFAAMEEAIASYWEKKKIFERSIEERPEHKPFVFYDGPPFATGLPHYGHLLQSVIKDVIPRYKTMQGYRVLRRWGWDCHGLPVEWLVEKEEGLASKEEVCAFGIQKFTESCRSSVFRYVGEWGKYIRRVGRWVDMENAYRTLDDDYIESVWWVFSELVKKGHIYKGHKTMLYSPKRATPLANFEINMDNSYAEKIDPAVTVKFKIKEKESSFLLAWTTTPWTLPSNVALAVHPNMVYVTVRMNETGEYFTFAETRMNEILKQYYPLDDPHQFGEHNTMPFEIVERHRGEELEGIRYEPLYDFYPVKNGHHVVTARYVSDTDGTGIVHIAPAYGEEDNQIGHERGLSFIDALDEQGRFREEAGFVAGMEYAEANNPIMENLASRGLLYRREDIAHSVPIDPRSKDPLMYRALPGWFVDVTALKPKLLDAAKRINWHPAHLKDGRFGHGLETAPDWNLSRTRFWGAPIPVWECGSCDAREIIGSLKDLRKKAVAGTFPEHLDLHRPAIDAVTLSCASCDGTMHRIPDVFDCWFESGSMPYASEHYPFENKARFESHFPADFIGEAQDQTRGWFYVLHVLSTALFGKPAFKDVVVTGLIMAEDGKKMSKSLGNYPDPWEILNTYGADAFRTYILSSPVVDGEQLNFSESEIDDVVRKFLNILWNVSVFYKTYAGTDRIELAKPRSAHVLDRWLYARLHGLIQDVTDAYERYEIVRAVRPLSAFVDDVSTWWLRRSRDRMRGADAYERLDALKTIREVLLDFSMLMAPSAPFMAERLYMDLEGPKASVHLERWPKADPRLIDEKLLEDMAWVRDIVSRGLEQRAIVKIPVRQALSRATIRMKHGMDANRLSAKTDLLALVKDELNVESVEFDLNPGDETTVVLDTALTPELKAKGQLRELIRRFMALRKERGLKPSDRIRAYAATADPALREVIQASMGMLMEQIKADDLDIPDTFPKQKDSMTFSLDGEDVELGIV